MMNKRHFLAALMGVLVLATGCTTTGPDSSDPATRRQSINSGVDNALATLYRQDPGSQQLVSTRARACWCSRPCSRRASSSAHGGATAPCARAARRSASTARTGGSFGLQAGAQSTAVFLLFMTDDALAQFQASRGWTAGVDATVTLLTVGANAQLTSATSQQPVIGYVLSNQGLMAGVTVDGSRITRLQL